MTILVTGGAGFIGANFILDWLAATDEAVVNLDKLTYAGNRANLAALDGDARHIFVHGDIADAELVGHLLAEHRPRAIVNLAAESHVDRSIRSPAEFVATNLVGTFHLLEAARAYWQGLDAPARAAFRLLQVSTDEVFGSLAPAAPAFAEDHPFRPNSPYSATKAGADHLVRAWHHTYGLPVLTTHCSNNYGPFHFPEKLIPLMIHNALAGKPLPLYGDGRQVRDWLYVGDHGAALRRVLEAGRPGETYNIGGACEKTNLEVAQTICAVLDEVRPRTDGLSYREQIRFVADRPGHDRRYAIDISKIRCELSWQPGTDFESGIRRTLQWYLDNPAWLQGATGEAYRAWTERQYQP